MKTSQHRTCQAGFTLIEMAIVVVIVGILISIAATVLPSLINSSKIRKARAILEKADYAIQGYISANGQCPCPDTTGDGREDRTAGANPPVDDTCAAYVGALPYATLGLSSGADVWQNPIRYGVYEDMVRTTTSTLCAALPCAPCLADFIGTPNTTWLRTSDGGTAITVAYVLASGGIKDMDGDSDFFDGLNASAATTAVFETPDRIMDNTTYDDLVHVGALTYLQGRLCSGGGGTTVAGVGAEHTFVNGCNNSVDDDGDGYVDCLDQDCFNISPCGTGGTNVTITTASLPSGVVNEPYSATIQATGGITPYQWSLSNTGGFSALFLHTYTAQLTGRLDQCPGTHNVTVQVADTTPASDGGPTTDTQSYSITVTSNLYLSRTSGGGSDIQWLSPTQEETFEANGGHLGDIAWSLNTGGANGFTVAAEGSGACTARKNGETTTGTGPYTFTLTGTDADCPSNNARMTFTVTIPASGTGATAPYTVGMEAQWRFDECTEWDGTSYDIEDSFGNPLHFGRRVGNVTGVHNGKICRAASFGGGTDRIVSEVLTGGDIMAFSDQVTLACWFKSPGGGGNNPRLIEFSDATGSSAQSTAIAYDTDGSLRAWVSGETGVRGGSVSYDAETYNDDTWHHVVYTYSTASGGRLYVDGGLKESDTSNPTSDIHDAETFVIGGYFPDGNNGFVGLIDEVAVFQRELTASEVVQYYDVTRSSCPGSCYTAPIAEYRMENAPWDGTAGEVYDTGSGGSNGTAAMFGVDGSLPTQTESDGGKICRSGVFTLSDINDDGTLDTASGGYLDFGDPGDGDLDPNTRAWSVCAWVNWNGSSGENIIYNKENLYEARVVSGQVHYAWQPHWVWDGGNSFTIRPDTWTHVATVYQGTEQTLFNNGEPVYRRYQAGAIGSNTSKLLIGARGSSNPNNFFRGMIDEVRIYDRALSQSEILSMVNETRSCP
jgi:prepilin-type N-terminal cleavage/methylation domain-containing protein